MSAKFFAAVVVSSIGLQCGCADRPRPFLINVTNDGFSVGGHVFKTRSELTDAIRLYGATDCRVMPGATTAYKQVEAAMLAVRDAGCSSGIIGSIQP